MAEQYFNLNLYDPAVPAFCSFDKMYVGTEENSIPFYEGMNKIYLSCTSSYLHTLEKLGFDNEHLMFVLGQGEEHNEASWSHHINNFLKLVNKISR